MIDCVDSDLNESCIELRHTIKLLYTTSTGTLHYTTFPLLVLLLFFSSSVPNITHHDTAANFTLHYNGFLLPYFYHVDN